MRIVFLLSMPRSGSTLLRLHLDRFPGAISVPETHFFVYKEQYAKYDPARLEVRKLVAMRWTNLHTIQKFPIDRAALPQRIIESATRWEEVFMFTLEAYRAAMKPGVADPLWIEKSPPHIFFQPAIRSMFPQAKASGIQQISKAMSQIDSATQQNAAASTQLIGQADHLIAITANAAKPIEKKDKMEPQPVPTTQKTAKEKANVVPLARKTVSQDAAKNSPPATKRTSSIASPKAPSKAPSAAASIIPFDDEETPNFGNTKGF